MVLERRSDAKLSSASMCCLVAHKSRVNVVGGCWRCWISESQDVQPRKRYLAVEMEPACSEERPTRNTKLQSYKEVYLQSCIWALIGAASTKSVPDGHRLASARVICMSLRSVRSSAQVFS